MASAILSAKDIHNHLVPLALSRGTRVVATRVVSSSISFYEGMLVASFPIRRKRGTPSRKGSLDVFASSFLPAFLRLALFQTPSTSYYFSRFPLTLGRTSGISRVHSERTHGRRNEVPFIYFAVGTRARNKGRRLGFLPRFTSLRPGAFCRSALLVLTGTSRRRKQNRREERNRGPKFSVVRAVLCREFT